VSEEFKGGSLMILPDICSFAVLPPNPFDLLSIERSNCWEGAALRGGGACSKHRPSSHPHGAARAVSATVSRKSDRPST
jgi:hypothetical protein